MKIAFLNIYQNKVDRGAETFVKELSSRLVDKHQVDLISGKERSQERWPILWRLFLDPNGLKVLFFTLKNIPKIFKEKYDIVIPLNGGWQVALIRIVTWLYGGKMVISGQSGMGWDDLNNLWSFPNAFVALSSQAQNWAKRKNPFVKSFYISNGVNLDKFSKNIKEIKVGLKKPVILCVAALTKTKRIDLVIKAVSKIKKASLLIVGDGDQKDYLVSLSNKLIKGRCEFLNVPYKDIQNIYRSADIFTLASEPYYAFENVIAEAMASGLGVVVNNDPIRKNIVGSAGLLIDPTNTQKYANTLKKALELDWRLKAKRQAQKFSWDKIARDYENLFIGLIK
ncbi:glycosyltransferase family 4 protein [Patescibacteria group bacterium]